MAPNHLFQTIMLLSKVRIRNRYAQITKMTRWCIAHITSQPSKLKVILGSTLLTLRHY